MFITNTVDNWLTLFYKLNDIIKPLGHKIIYEAINDLTNKKESCNLLIEAFYEAGFNNQEILVILDNIKDAYLYDSIINSIEEIRDRCGITKIILLFDIKKIKLKEKEEVYLARELSPFIKDGYVELLSDEEFIITGEENIILYVYNFCINPHIFPIKKDLDGKRLVLKRSN